MVNSWFSEIRGGILSCWVVAKQSRRIIRGFDASEKRLPLVSEELRLNKLVGCFLFHLFGLRHCLSEFYFLFIYRWWLKELPPHCTFSILSKLLSWSRAVRGFQKNKKTLFFHKKEEERVPTHPRFTVLKEPFVVQNGNNTGTFLHIQISVPSHLLF